MIFGGDLEVEIFPFICFFFSLYTLYSSVALGVYSFIPFTDFMLNAFYTLYSSVDLVVYSFIRLIPFMLNGLYT